MDDNRQRPDVGATVDRPAARLLRTHVGDRADQGLRIGDGSVVNRAIPKSRIFAVPSGRITMLEGLTSRWTMPASCACSSPRATCSAIGSASSKVSRPRVQARLQRFALVERHGDEQLPVLGLADLVDRAHVRMVERGRRARLSDEPRLGAADPRRGPAAGISARPDVRAARLALGRRRPCRRSRSAPAPSTARPASGPFRDRVSHPCAGWLHERRQPVDDALAFVGEQQRLDFLPEGGSPAQRASSSAPRCAAGQSIASARTS